MTHAQSRWAIDRIRSGSSIRKRHAFAHAWTIASYVSHTVWLSLLPRRAESARGISPRAAHRSGLDTLASSGSCHQPKAAAFRRELELLLSPVGPLPTSVTCPLCSTGITPLHHYYGAVRPWPAHQYFRPRGWAACAFSLRIADQVLKFHARAQMRVTPPIHRTPYGQ